MSVTPPRKADVDDTDDAELWGQFPEITSDDIRNGLCDTREERLQRQAHNRRHRNTQVHTGLTVTPDPQPPTSVSRPPTGASRRQRPRARSDDSVFVIAEEDALRSAPFYETPETHQKYEAYVVFHGRRMGVFQTWYAQVLSSAPGGHLLVLVSGRLQTPR